MSSTHVARGGPSRGRATTGAFAALAVVFVMSTTACAVPDGAVQDGAGRDGAVQDGAGRDGAPAHDDGPGGDEPEQPARPDLGEDTVEPPPDREGRPEIEDDAAEEPRDRAAPTPERPTRVLLPAIGVDATVIGLALRDDGTIEVPPDGVDAGWFRDGARPGEPGPTVIGAHVDWAGVPGVFADLAELVVGDVITVQDAAGRSIEYRVDGSQQHRKDDLPTFEVYGVTAEDTLRLVTCAGPFDRTARSYRDNLVVFATAVG